MCDPHSQKTKKNPITNSTSQFAHNTKLTVYVGVKTERKSPQKPSKNSAILL